MPAGREMDALVAESIGLDVERTQVVTFTGDPATMRSVVYAIRKPVETEDEYGFAKVLKVSDVYAELPRYSTDDAAALEVLSVFPRFQIEKTGPDTFICHLSRQAWPDPDHQEVVEAGFTLAQAICRAALKASLT